MFEIKHMPNILTAGRIVCAVWLLRTEPLSLWFFVLYLFCGVSDILDGYIARKTKSASPFGAALDSVADAVFIGVLLMIFIPMLPWPLWILRWTGAIVLIRLISLTVGFAKYRALSSLHTYANKVTGLLLFFFPFLYSLLGLTATAFIVCGAATLSAVEELAINATSKELSRDIGGLFKK